MPASLPITAPNLSENYCFTTYQQLANDIVGGATVQLDNSGWTMVLKQDTTPTSSQRAYLWFKTSDSKLYAWRDDVSAWVTAHPSVAFGSERRLWIGTLTDLKTFDGGDTGTVGFASGPMWEEDTAFAGRIPIGVGTTAGGTAVSAAANAGADKVSLVVGNIPLPDHRHFTVANASSAITALTTSHQIASDADVSDNTDYRLTGTTTEATLCRTSPVIEPQSTVSQVNVLNPVRGIYIIKRSGRVYYKGA